MNRFLMEAQEERIVDKNLKGDEDGEGLAKTKQKLSPIAGEVTSQILIIYFECMRVKAGYCF